MPRKSKEAQERQRDQVARHDHAASESMRDIAAELRKRPECLNPERHERGRLSLFDFGMSYFPNRFKIECADFHREGAAVMQACTDNGETHAFAWPRGSGKDTWAEVAILRAMLYGIRRFVLFFCATDGLAKKSLRKIQKEIETNPLLLEDFRGACFPVRKLERITRRAQGQTFDKKPTFIEWGSENITFPTIPGSASSGAMVYGFGLTGAFRGLSILDASGHPLRPDLFVFTDAQTRDSAKSLMQTDERESLICDDALQMVDPTTSAAAMFLCTVIQPNDLADRFLSPEIHAEWQGVRVRMLEAFPSNLDLWDQYADIRKSSFREGRKGRDANEFYLANRDKMDEGARVSWVHRIKKGDISAIQTAMNFYYTNPRGFWAEMQNEPKGVSLGEGVKHLIPSAVSARVSGVDRLVVPMDATCVSAFIDVGQSLLWFAVVAWNPQFGGSVLDYGAWPRQNRSTFEANDPRPGIGDMPGFESLNDKERVYAALNALTNEIMSATYQRIGGGAMQIERLLIDCGWETATVYKFIQHTPHAKLVHPSRGKARTTTSRGIHEGKPKPGEKKGYHWRLKSGEFGRTREVQFDADAWKSFVYNALSVNPGGRGGLELWGKSAAPHELVGQHCAAERAEPITVHGTTFDKWDVTPDRPDNHLWDCLVGAAVAASVTGLEPSASVGSTSAPEVAEPTSYAEAKAQRTAPPPAATPNTPPTEPKVPTCFADILAERQRKR